MTNARCNKEYDMFWNDPNLYSVAFKDIPNVPLPFYGTTPRFYTPFTPFDVKPPFFTPPIDPRLYTPQIPYFTPPIDPRLYTPQTPFFTPPIDPRLFTPPVTPFMHTPGIPQYVNPILGPYNYTMPYFQGHRPFGL